MSKSETHVALFCGGRGSASIVRELLRWPTIRLTLLVNAYDDGLSTGALRTFIPGMLGPSDFRKNLSYLLDLYSTQQYALQRLIEYRLPRDVSEAEIARLKHFARGGATTGISPALAEMLCSLDVGVSRRIRDLLANFFDHAERSNRSFDFPDCSFGNLIFAGAYLESGNFNAAARELTRLFGSRAELVNVSRGECRSLLAIKEDGTLLFSEAEIVGPQSPSPIRETYFMDVPITAEQWANVADGGIEEKQAWLRAKETMVEMSPEAEAAIADADIIVYGPGTQHSSLLPSYRIAAAALKKSRAAAKVFVANLHHDHDIQGFSAADLIDRALRYAGDPENQQGVITHVLYNRADADNSGSVPLDRSVLDDQGCYRRARFIEGSFANPVDQKVHSGHSIVRAVVDLYEKHGAAQEGETIEIYVDLITRSLALTGLLQEFLEIGWRGHFRHVRMRINGIEGVDAVLPPHLAIERTHHESMFSEVAVLLEWLSRGNSDYLATITGDGEYRLRDVLLGVTLLRSGSFGAVYGSRNQSRGQFRTSLNAAYGEGTALFALSWLGAFLLTALFGLRFRAIFSDPLTGFRIYQRVRLRDSFLAAASARPMKSAASVTKLLVRSGVEIAEIPVGYRTFTGFTRPSWRLWRGIRNLIGALR